MAESFGNQPTTPTTLTGAITNVQTTIGVSTGSAPWPASGQFRIRFISGELALVTGGQGTTTWTVVRGIEGTTAASQPNGSIVIPVLTAGALGQFNADIIASISGVAPISVSGGIVSITDADSTHRGAMTAAYAAMLTNATNSLVNSTLVLRNSTGDFAGRQITATELYSTTATVQGGAPTSIIGVTAGSNMLQRYNPSNLVAGSIVSQANSATIAAATAATASTIVLRDSSGGGNFASLVNTFNEGLTTQPYMLWGRDVSSGTLRTFNPSSLAVGSASSASFASTAGTANNATNWVGHNLISTGGNWAISPLTDQDISHSLGQQPRIWNAFYALQSEGFAAVPTHPCVPGRFSGSYTDEVVVALVDSTKISFRNRRNEIVYVYFSVMA